MSPFVYTPFYFLAVYAFIFEKEWIRIPGLHALQSSQKSLGFCSYKRLPFMQQSFMLQTNSTTFPHLKSYYSSPVVLGTVPDVAGLHS